MIVDVFGHPAFVELTPPSLEDLHRLAARIAEAVLALLRRRRIWLDDLDESEDPVAQRSESLAGMAKASSTGNLVFGSAGAKPVRLQDARVRVPDQVERAGKALGFVLDAEVRVGGQPFPPREAMPLLVAPTLGKGKTPRNHGWQVRLRAENAMA